MKQQQLEPSNHLILHMKYCMQSIVILLCGITMLFSSCKNDVEKVKDFGDGGKLPFFSAKDFETVYSDSAQTRFLMRTPELNSYKDDKEEYDEFPQGVFIQEYDAQRNPGSSLKCDYAKHIKKEKLWEARINVVATNGEGDTLKTEQLFWDEQKQKVYTDNFVRFITKDRMITGTGFEADQDLSDADVKNIKGTIKFDDNRVKKSGSN
ncbi:LPS export ABC transporter periplasmic protein LptC [Puteibacter caeruleilacunae]|nr:LPS export ABC transporter periplasmic protein LptC [Puteibacter caeruleilacunae]